MTASITSRKVPLTHKYTGTNQTLNSLTADLSNRLVSLQNTTQLSHEKHEYKGKILLYVLTEVSSRFYEVLK